MYYLLVEAAGMRQIAKIRPERYQGFSQKLDSVMKRGGFSAILHEGDLVLFGQDREITVQPQLLASVARSMMDVLRSEAEDLLDFLLIVDYRETENGQEELARMQRLLRRARSQNAVYVTQPVWTAIEPLIEAEQQGDLYRIVAFTGREQVVRRRYVDSIVTAEVGRQVSQAIDPEPAGTTWFVARDTSEVAAALAGVEVEASAHVVIQARPESTTETILQAVVAQLLKRAPESYPVYGVEEIDRRAQWAISELHARFADPTVVLLSEGWRRGELGMLIARWAVAAAGGGEWILVEIRDFDQLAPEVARSVERYLTPDVAAQTVRLVVTAAESPPTFPDEADAHEDRHVVELNQAGAGRFAAALAYWNKPHHDPRQLSEHHRHLMYVLYRLRGILGDDAVTPFVAAVGITPAERVRIVQELEDLGVVQRLWTLQTNPAAESLITSSVTVEERSSLEDMIYQVMVAQLRSGAVPLSQAILGFLEEEPERWRSGAQRHAVLHNLAGGGAFDALERIVGEDGATPQHARVTEASARIRLYLRDSRGPEFCAEDAALVRSVVGDETIDPEVRADFLLSLGEFHLAERDYQQTLKAAKNATVLLQASRSSRIGASHLLMARVLLVQRRLNDAGQYLNFAREEARGDMATELIARSIEAIRLFLSGNLSRSATQFTELIEPLLRSGFTEWLLLAWFALGRIDFELGAYHRSAAQFSMSHDWANACEMKAPARTIGAWMRRAHYLADETLSGDYFSRDLAGMTAEEKLFVAEARIARKEYQEALELLDAAEEEERDAPRWPRLGVCWDNGYAPMEDLLIADRVGRSELLRMIQAFRAWMLSLTDRQDEAVDVLYRLTRGNEGLSVDPYAGLFNYLYSCILPAEHSADRDDRTTVLGKSVKLVQERMSRIDDYRDKLRYLSSNTWNRRLMDAARRQNLVS